MLPAELITASAEHNSATKDGELSPFHVWHATKEFLFSGG
jgi:hypothetical protein